MSEVVAEAPREIARLAEEIARLADPDDGGPAFPCEQGVDPNGNWNQTFEPGMSLRDYVAARAMHADLTYQGLEGREDLGHVAAMAYEMADAMLEARSMVRRPEPRNQGGAS